MKHSKQILEQLFFTFHLSFKKKISTKKKPANNLFQLLKKPIFVDST